ncbi:YopX family protein [Enterococcus faecalis]|uniref:YopX family protein n=1 Tax=Enterococcus faecalis TaxID=1351 RepID=UPI003DA0E9E3
MILKFRAWDKNTNDMVHVKTKKLKEDGSIGCIVDYIAIELGVTECVIPLLENGNLKNGVEIFDGDIV